MAAREHAHFLETSEEVRVLAVRATDPTFSFQTSPLSIDQPHFPVAQAAEED